MQPLFMIPTGVVGLLGGGYLYQRLGRRRDRQQHPPRGRLVDVGGYRLHLEVTGKGTPTIILDSSMGVGLDWAAVQPDLAEHTKVVSYDRAGFGWSDPGPRPRRCSTMVRELRTALDRAGIDGPYILVGHVFGGMVMRLFASRYPEDVCAVVLADALHPDKAEHLPEAFHTYEEDVLRSFNRLRLVAPFGVIRLVGTLGLSDELTKDLEMLPKDVRPAVEAAMYRAEHWRTAYAEHVDWPKSADDIAQASDLGDLPLTVLTHRSSEWPPWLPPDFPRGQVDAAVEGWQAMQRKLVALSTNSRIKVEEDSDYQIPFKRPRVLVDSVLERLSEVSSAA